MLSAGTRVGPYEIVSWLGAGGMGEVYRARDTKLGREVALKTLPEDLAHQPDRLARLKQEARILAALNHPGIATLHGLEESGNGVPVLVMELVEGETLADRLRRGPLPLPQALKVGQETAVALEAAHEKGVLHRDLKPANIRLARDGRVKLLDFGLAKAVREAGLDSQVATHTSPSSGAAIVGTTPYLSPEQARGQEVDRRSDVWAFGCVFFEMLAGRRAFEGLTFSDTVAAILDREPDWSALPPGTPSAAVRLLRRCLKKDKDKRLHDVADARLELEELLAEPASTGGGANDTAVIGPRRVTGPGVFGSRLVWLLVGIAAVAAGLWALRTAKPVAERPVVRFVIPLPGPVWAMAWSPDGAHLAHPAWRGGDTWQIYVRGMDRLEETAIPGTERATNPFYSPDGRWMGFWAHGLKKVPIAGGPPLTVCDCTGGAPGAMGASWGPDGTIVFAPNAASGLLRVSAEGGAPQVLTTIDPSRHESSHRFPEVLPGGQAVVFTVKPPEALSWDEARIEAVSLRTGERSVLFTGGTAARYVAPGYLVYYRAGSLWAVPFDAARLKVTGPPVLVLEGVSSDGNNGKPDFRISPDGSLAYLAGKPRGVGRQLLRVDRAGRRRPVTDLRRGFDSLRLSPDGRRLALQITGANEQIWVYDLERGTMTSLTHGWDNTGPIWTPDGRRLIFSSNRDGSALNLFWQPADGSGPAERLGKSANEQRQISWSPDGKDLVYVDGEELRVLALGGDRQSRPLLGPWGPGLNNVEVSPNGRWLAYNSEESGRHEVYVTSFPEPGSRWTISTDGGGEPLWARNGRELYYCCPHDRLMAVTVASDPTFSASKPRALFEIPPTPDNMAWSYDVTRDGEFLMIEAGDSELPPSQINVVLNWAQELKQRLATR